MVVSETTNNTLSTGTMVLILVGVVKGVFICFALMAVCYRRKSTVQKYDQPYVKKPPQRGYSGVSGNHHPGHAVLDNVNNKILTFSSMPNCREHKSQVKRPGMSEEDGDTGADEVVSFIDLPNNLTKLPEKGILKKHGMGGGAVASVERTLDQLNGYHEHIIEALRMAANQRETSGTTSAPMDDEALTEPLTELLTEPLPECYPTDSYRKDIIKHIDNQADEEYEEYVPSCGVIRIRNLEDLIKQLERHSARNRSPSGSEDMRMSESEADRPYRKDSSVCSESSQGSTTSPTD